MLCLGDLRRCIGDRAWYANCIALRKDNGRWAIERVVRVSKGRQRLDQRARRLGRRSRACSRWAAGISGGSRVASARSRDLRLVIEQVLSVSSPPGGHRDRSSAPRLAAHDGRDSHPIDRIVRPIPLREAGDATAAPVFSPCRESRDRRRCPLRVRQRVFRARVRLGRDAEVARVLTTLPPSLSTSKTLTRAPAGFRLRRPSP